MKPVLALLFVVALVGCERNGGGVVGTLERDRVEIPAELSEPVTELHVREGAHVQKGDPLLQLDDKRARAELLRLEAEQQRWQRRLDEVVRGPREERIREAEARLETARGRLQVAQREFERLRLLAAESLASENALDSARAALDSATGERDAARAALDALLEGATVEELDQARAQLAAAEAAVSSQRVVVDRLSVEAPRGGLVEALPWKEGSQPPRGSAVAVLLAGGPPYARVHVPVSEREWFRKDARVSVRVEGFGDYAGRVRWISADAVFTPYFALTEHDRDRLSHAAEITLQGENAAKLPAGLPVAVHLSDEHE